MDEVKRWDSVAEAYQRTFRRGGSDYSERLISFLSDNKMIWPGSRVVDIGCGVGKYGTYFASMGCDVTLTDISSEMLRHAESNMRKYSSPWRTMQLDFSTDKAAEALGKGDYDLAVSTMSPAIHDLGSVIKMSSLSRGWCFVTQFISWEQAKRDAFYAALGLESPGPFKGMENGAAEIIRAVSDAGYVPLVKYEPYSWRDDRSPREAAEYLLRDIAPEEGLLRRGEQAARMLSDENGRFRDTVNTKTAWIYWAVEGK